MPIGRVALILACIVVPARAVASDIDIGAVLEDESFLQGKVSPEVIKLQVMLDRANASPGEIDGIFKPSLITAIDAYAEIAAVSKTSWLKRFWLRLALSSAEPALTDYKITEDDLKQLFSPLLGRLEDMQNLKAAGYTSIREALAEKFHMSEDLLVELNPRKTFAEVGESITVANVKRTAKAMRAVRLDVDKQSIRAYSKTGDLMAFFPASVGSDEKPSPSGKLKVTSIVSGPTFHYNPKYHFKEVATNRPFDIAEGPNNPLGSMWIGLSKASYGIHGTPDPSGVGVDSSHGCVRVTNWDADRLAGMLVKGVTVNFVEPKKPTTDLRDAFAAYFDDRF
jgi:lipoprotein-anchoring transpeptidase ErfK/SrfK